VSIDDPARWRREPEAFPGVSDNLKLGEPIVSWGLASPGEDRSVWTLRWSNIDDATSYNVYGPRRPRPSKGWRRHVRRQKAARRV
jgi:hypothetical protein